jgi:hypothetical protein
MSRRAAIGLAVLACAGAAFAQGPLAFRSSPDHPAIAYSTAPLADAVTVLNARLEAGTARLTHDPDSGYLPSVLQALRVPKESQIAVFSPTSLQAEMINARNPRAVFFNDSVAVGWVRGGMIEVAAQDPQLGPVFYQLDQRPDERPRFRRADRDCLECHRSWETLAVPGLFVLTTFPPTTKNGYATGGVTDQRSALAERWAGWYVTGRPGANRHMGNKPTPSRADTSGPVVLDSLAGRFDLKGYPTPYSDIAALLVFEHQAHMTNLLTYLNWESRVAAAERRGDATVRQAARDLVDYMLFVDEAPLAGKIEGTAGFTQMFSAEGPRDARGRSLRQLDLERRLMRYPCSYMIYSQAFEALPAMAKDAVYRRMWQVLSGEETQKPYTRLSLADRRAIVEILRDTKKGLPDYFQLVNN